MSIEAYRRKLTAEGSTTEGSPIEYVADFREGEIARVPAAEISSITDPDREVVFYAIGFETTAPSTALTPRARAVRSLRGWCSCTPSSAAPV